MTLALILAVVLVLTLMISPRFNGGLYRAMIFAPIKAKSGDYKADLLEGVEKRDVYFKSGGSTLHAYLFERQGADKIILFSHSNWGNVDEWRTLIARLLETGSCSVFAYDYRGFGLSDGKPSVAGICADGLAAYDYLVDRLAYDPSQIILFGSSLGSGVSTEIAGQRQCAGIILHAAFSSLRELTISLISWARLVPNLVFFRPAMNNAANLRRIDRPLLLVHGELDKMVPLAHAERNLESSPAGEKKLVVLTGCSHMDTRTEGNLFVQSVAEFLERLH